MGVLKFSRPWILVFNYEEKILSCKLTLNEPHTASTTIQNHRIQYPCDSFLCSCQMMVLKCNVYNAYPSDCYLETSTVITICQMMTIMQARLCATCLLSIRRKQIKVSQKFCKCYSSKVRRLKTSWYKCKSNTTIRVSSFNPIVLVLLNKHGKVVVDKFALIAGHSFITFS